MNTISVDDPNSIHINPNPPSLVASTITLPIKIDAEIPFPEFRKFISEYMTAIQEKIPTRLDRWWVAEVLKGIWEGRRVAWVPPVPSQFLTDTAY